MLGMKSHREKPPDTVPIDRRTGIVEVEMSYTEEQAVEQAKRCFALPYTDNL
jgi:hypothetical protein